MTKLQIYLKNRVLIKNQKSPVQPFQTSRKSPFLFFHITTTYLLKSLIICALFLLSISCGQIIDKGSEVTDKAIQQAKKQTLNVTDKVVPRFDSQTPDTRFNKKRFTEYLEVELTEDIRNIYAYGDFIGIDYKVMISFKCDTSTLHRIVQKKGMEVSLTEHDNGLHFLTELEWWEKEKIKQITPFKKGEEYKYWEYLWYDNETNTAYYQEFSM